MQIETVDFVSVPTRDYARAVAWYRDVLGLQVSEYTDTEVETPNLTLSFWLPEEQGQKFVPNENGIALRVADVHTAVEEVRAAGADVMGIEDSGVCHMGFLKDPDGNVLILHRRYAPRAPLRGADHDVRAQADGRASKAHPASKRRRRVGALAARPSAMTGRVDPAQSETP